MSSANINYISLHEAAKLTNYSQDYISLLCRQKKLKGEKLGRNWVTTKEWVESYINKTNGSGQNIVSVKIKNAEKQIGQLSQAGSTQSMEPTDKILKHTPNSSQEGNKELAANLIPREEFILIFFRRIILATFVVGIFSIGFVFFQNNISSSVNQAVGDSKKIMANASFSLNSFLSSFDKNNIKKESGTVAGVKTFVGEENDSETENKKENNGLVIIPLEGEINSEENQRFIKKLSSSFSDDVEISPSDDGVSGVITSRENPDENFIYLMVPVKED